LGGAINFYYNADTRVVGYYTIAVAVLLLPFHIPLWPLGAMLYPFRKNFYIASFLMIGYVFVFERERERERERQRERETERETERERERETERKREREREC